MFGDHRALRSHVGVELLVVSPFCRKVVFVEDGRNRAFRNAGFTIDAFIRVDEQDCFAFVKALHWTNDYAVCVFTVEARLSDDMSHVTPFPARSSGCVFRSLIRDNPG